MSLPESWVETTVSKVIRDIQPGFAQKPGEDNEGMTPQIRTHNISPTGEITLEGIKYVSASEKELVKYQLTVGDVVFNNTNSEEWVGKSAIFDQEGEFVFSNHMTRLRTDPSLIIPEYLSRYLHFLQSIGFSKTRAKRWVSQAGIEGSTLASFKLPLPVLKEQQRIIDILSHAESLAKLHHKLDDLLIIVKQKLFVDMFGDPSPKVNDAWPIIKLGSVVTVATGGTPSRDQPDSYGGSVCWVKSTDLIDESISQTDECLTGIGIKRSNANVYPKETIMLAMYGQGQTRGRTGKLLIDAACNQACAALLPSEELLPDYIWIWFQLSYEAVRFLGRGGQQENLNLKIIRDIKIPKPPVSLQHEFSRSLNQLLEVMNSSYAAKKQLETLLISVGSEALTGEITALWRDKHLDEIIEITKARDDKLRKRGTKITKRTDQVPKLMSLNEMLSPTRHWLIDELSVFQQRVLQAFIIFPNQPLLAEDPIRFSEFCEDDILAEQLAGFSYSPNHIRRTLGQLASLGLIAKITVPKIDSLTLEIEYLKAFRPLREEEDSRLADSAALRRTLLGTKSSTIYKFYAILDYETSERAGAGGMFQVSSLTDDVGHDHSSLIDQGRHYESEHDLKTDIAKAVHVNVNQIELIGL